MAQELTNFWSAKHGTWTEVDQVERISLRAEHVATAANESGGTTRERVKFRATDLLEFRLVWTLNGFRLSLVQSC